MSKLNLEIELNNLSKEDRDKFLELVEKSKGEKAFNPFERVETNMPYCYIDDWGVIKGENEVRFLSDIQHYNVCNYYNDGQFAKNQALRELLNRKLMKFSYENGGAEIKSLKEAYTICHEKDGLYVSVSSVPHILSPLFMSIEVAQRAVDEIIKPFMNEHPDFKWWG